jgi:hypothetical protein
MGQKKRFRRTTVAAAKYAAARARVARATKKRASRRAGKAGDDKA